VRGERRLHDMTTLAAQLGSLHMPYGVVRALGPDHDVDRCCYGEEVRQPTKVSCPVLGRKKTVLDALTGEEKSESNEDQPRDEDNRNHDEQDDADVRIAGAT
jgi:hypothetical protein